ncbi:hypothetical protein [Paenibacillus harenae]|uniref:DUF1269 domain-containing protein n=1 Tax=Paenibacillus harenae TaxID=306543 RepID=A0ABT9UAT5_PAEHA|nr:hypothetical protein [Paenibacillus harenae]MDQ0116126.1 hypothetical protein [Paenibacillus harenae]
MIIIGTFRHSIELEQALVMLEKIGVSPNRLLVVCMDSDSNDFSSNKKNIDEGSYSKSIEVGMACATALSVVGTSVGFILTWGPIIWGLLASIIGFCLGFGITAIIQRPITRRLKKKPEVTVIVQCHADQSDQIREAMRTNHALSIGLAHASAE